MGRLRPQLNPVYNAFLYQYGKPISQLIAGIRPLAVGLLTLRAKDIARETGWKRA